jgi:predicted dehydrogenase/D-arabinose 1-dehydrogenase-like Zn-dependent alcohol dehydrogenase
VHPRETVKQLLQHLDSGRTDLLDVPLPAVGPGEVLVRTVTSVISAGTERMLVEFGRAGWIEKARTRPDKVRQVIDKARTDGLGPTLAAVQHKLAAPIPLGYCNAGVVAAVGSGVTSVSDGDRVVSNGPHAEYVCVPERLVARIPDTVSFDDAAFAPVAAIALQGIRLSEATIGETIVVYGLGLIGLSTVQILRAAGCRVIGIDTSPQRLGMAAEFGATVVDATAGPPDARIIAATSGVGADAVLLTLASSSDEPVHYAASMSRKKGRLVLVGVTGLALQRDDFYKKELSIVVSSSYGPGRYDPAYERNGQDYPVSHVRWTAQRNFEAVLGLMADRAINMSALVSHRFQFERAPAAYDIVLGAAPSLGILLNYPDAPAGSTELPPRTLQATPRTELRAGTPRAAVIGAGNFATRTIIPALVAQGFDPTIIASKTGASAAIAGRRFGFTTVTSDPEAAIHDPSVDVVFVLTRHDSHARLAVRALEAGKHVFVEKPLALTDDDLDRVEQAVVRSGRLLMVGFNRRFAPLTAEARKLMAGRAGPLSIVITVNAGAVPPENWTQDRTIGGGRIVGEACHFIDLARALVGQPITGVTAMAARGAAGHPVTDIASINLAFEDGSIATVHYLANGSNAFPKERVECFFDGKVIAIENWRRLRRYGMRGPLLRWRRGQDKGHDAELGAWVAAVTGRMDAPIPLSELLEVSRWSVRAAAAVRGA